MSLDCDRNIHDAISTRKVPKHTWLHLMFPLDIFAVEMMSFTFLSQHRKTQAIFYSLTTKCVFISGTLYIYIYIYIYICK